MVVREDPDAEWKDVGLISKKWTFFVPSTGSYLPQKLSQDEYEEMRRQQRTTPYRIMRDGRKWWWMYQDKFYYITEPVGPSEAEVMIEDHERKRKRKTEKARHRVEAAKSSEAQRKPIPDEVKTKVWRRDQGECVNCGSQENLEFDHIIPVSKGGANTFRNIQLLCEQCNRSKGGDLV